MNLTNRIRLLIEVLKQPKFLAIFSLILIFLTPLLAISSDIIVPTTLEVNRFADPLKIILIGIITVLLSLNFTVFVYKSQIKQKSEKKTTLFGMITALITTACPICQPIWLVWLGLGSATAFLSEVSIYLATSSIFLLGFSLYKSTELCEVK